MRKIYDEYLYMPEQGEGVVREKVFFSRLVLSIACMVVCMIAIGYNAYAFFTANVASTANTLQAATYSFDVKGVPTQANEGTFSVVDGARHKYKLGAGTYDFTFTKSDDASATTGYCRIDIGEGESVQQLYTQQIGGVYDGETEIVSRTIRITVDSDTIVQFVECWGTYAGNVAAEIPSEVITENQKMIEAKGTSVNAVIHVEPTATNSGATNPTALTSTEETNTQDSGTTAPQPETSTQDTGTTSTESEKATEGADTTDVTPKDEKDDSLEVQDDVEDNSASTEAGTTSE